MRFILHRVYFGFPILFTVLDVTIIIAISQEWDLTINKYPVTRYFPWMVVYIYIYSGLSLFGPLDIILVRYTAEVFEM
jgi:hypothetical protein